MPAVLVMLILFVSALYYYSYGETACLNKTASSVLLSNFNGYTENRGSPISATANVLSAIALISLATLALSKMANEKHVNFVFSFMVVTQLIYAFIVSYGANGQDCIIGGISLFDTNSFAVAIAVMMFYLTTSAYSILHNAPPRNYLPVSFSTTAIAAYLTIYFLVQPTAAEYILSYALIMTAIAAIYHVLAHFAGRWSTKINSRRRAEEFRAFNLMLLVWPAFLVSALAVELYVFFLTKHVHTFALAIFALFLAIYFMTHVIKKHFGEKALPSYV